MHGEAGTRVELTKRRLVEANPRRVALVLERHARDLVRDAEFFAQKCLGHAWALTLWRRREVGRALERVGERRRAAVEDEVVRAAARDRLYAQKHGAVCGELTRLHDVAEHDGIVLRARHHSKLLCAHVRDARGAGRGVGGRQCCEANARVTRSTVARTTERELAIALVDLQEYVTLSV